MSKSVSNYEYSTLSPQERAKWLKKRCDNKQISIEKDGSIWYASPQDSNKTKGLQDLFNIPSNQIEKHKQKDGSVKYKVDDVFKLEKVETQALQKLIVNYKNNNIGEKYYKRFDWFQANKDEIKVKNGEIYYKAQSGTSYYSMAQLFNTTVKEIKSMNNATSNDIKLGQEYHVDSGYKLDDLEMKFLGDKLPPLVKLRRAVMAQSTPKSESFDLNESGAEYIKGRENGYNHMDKSKKKFQVYQGDADKPGVLTVAHGHAGKNYKIIIDGKTYKKGDFIPEKLGDVVFERDVEAFIEQMETNAGGSKLKQHHKDAAISYAFNTGGDQLISNTDPNRATFAELLAQGKTDEAQGRFNIITVNNKPVAGLVNRRIEELGIFCNGSLSKEGLNNLKYIMGEVKMKDSYIDYIMKNLNDYGIDNAEKYEKILRDIKSAYEISDPRLQKKALDAIKR